MLGRQRLIESSRPDHVIPTVELVIFIGIPRVIIGANHAGLGGPGDPLTRIRDIGASGALLELGDDQVDGVFREELGVDALQIEIGAR